MFAWLAALDGKPISTAIVTGSRRSDARTTMVLRYPRNAVQPDLAVKVALDAAGLVRLENERVALSTFAASASRAGAEIPRPVPVEIPYVMATRMLPGDVAAVVLDGHASRLDDIASRLVEWLAEWNQITATTRVATPEDLQRFVLESADRVAASDPGLTEYRRQIGELTRRVHGQTLVLVAAHNDLTLANVLLSSHKIGVLDWEGAEADVLPMTDLWYALSDAVARRAALRTPPRLRPWSSATRPSRSRSERFQRVWRTGSRFQPMSGS